MNEGLKLALFLGAEGELVYGCGSLLSIHPKFF